VMVQALLNLSEPPQPPDAADALAVALCHALKRGSPVTTHSALGTRHSALP
jgi:crossover junction endodeoxyribonuclease RuvC